MRANPPQENLGLAGHHAGSVQKTRQIYAQAGTMSHREGDQVPRGGPAVATERATSSRLSTTRVHRIVERHRRDAAIDQVQLETPQVFERRSIRRAPEKAGEALHRAAITWSGSLGQLAQSHVVEPALAKRADGCALLRIRSASVAERSGLAHS